jgi:hypothetical protein
MWGRKVFDGDSEVKGSVPRMYRNRVKKRCMLPTANSDVEQLSAQRLAA